MRHRAAGHPRNSLISICRRIGLAVLIVLLSPVLAADGESAAAPARLPRVDAQRIETIGRLGGLVTAGIPLQDGSVLMAEGPALLLLDTTQGVLTVRESLDPGHGIILDMTRAGDVFFVLTEEGTAVLISAGSNLPTVAGFAPGSGQSVAATATAGGAVAVVAAREAGLRVLHTDPRGRLLAQSTLALEGKARDVALSVSGEQAVVAAGEAGLHVVDLTDPAAPKLLRTLTAVHPAEAVEMVGALLAAASGGAILALDPLSGDNSIVGVYAPLRAGQRVIAEEEFIYAADVVDGLKIFWRAAPDRLVQVYGERGHPVSDLWVEGDLAYVVGADGLRILDIGNRYRPLEISRLPLPGTPQGIAVTPQRAFVALGDEGVAVVDISNLSSPRLRRRISVVHDVRAVVFHEDALYAATGEDGLAVIDPAAPGTETLLGLFALPGSALDLARRGDVLYVAGGEAGLLSVDITRPAAPVLAGLLAAEAGRSISSVTISGKRAYVCGDGGLGIVDITSPVAMGWLAQADSPAAHAAVAGDTLFVVSGSQIDLYDVGATARPLLLRTYRGIGMISGLAAQGDRLFVSSGGDGPELAVLSLKSPDYPVELDSTARSGQAYRAWPAGSEVWLARGYAGLRRFVVTEGGALISSSGYAAIRDTGRLAQDSARLLIGGRDGWSLLGLDEAAVPRSLGQALDGLPVRDLALEGDAVAIAAGDQGIVLYRLEQDGPALVAQQPTRGPAAGTALDDSYVYAADAGGLSIFDRYYLQPVAHVSTPAPPTGIALHEGHAYLPLADGQLAVVDLGSPAGGLQTRSTIPTRRPHALVPGADAHTVYALADDQVMRIQILNTGDLAVTQRGQLAALASSGFFSGGLLWAINPDEGVRLYDLSLLDTNDEAIELRNVAVAAQDIVVNGSTAYVAYGAGGMGLYDLRAQVAAPVFYGGEVNALYRDGDTLFALGTSLTAWRITEGSGAELVATLPLAAAGTHLSAAGDGRLLLSLKNGLGIVVWDGRRLALIGQLTTTDAVDRAIQAGTHAFLALHNGGVLVADLSNPARPLGLFSFTSPSGRFVRDLLPMDEDRLLVSWEGGIDLLDISAAVRGPHLAGVFEVGRSPVLAITLSTDGQRAALALGEEGVRVVELPADGSAPEPIGFVDTPGAALRAALGSASGTDMLYVADGMCGLRVIDLGDSANPRERGYWRSSYASDVMVHSVAEGDVIYLAEANQLLTLRYDGASGAVPPPMPQTAVPGNGQDDLPLTLTLAWGPPPDSCDPLTYSIYFGAVNPPPLLGVATGTPALQIGGLEPLRTYYWRVVATDRQGDSSEGPLWHFTTASGRFVDTLQSSPPPLVEQVRQAPLLLLALAGAVAAAAGTGWLVWRGQRRKTDDG